MPKMATFWKTEACGQTVLLDKSILIILNLVENATLATFRKQFYQTGQF